MVKKGKISYWKLNAQIVFKPWYLDTELTKKLWKYPQASSRDGRRKDQRLLQRVHGEIVDLGGTLPAEVVRQRFLLVLMTDGKLYRQFTVRINRVNSHLLPFILRNQLLLYSLNRGPRFSTNKFMYWVSWNKNLLNFNLLIHFSLICIFH